VKKVIGVLAPLLAITSLFIILGGCAKSVPQEPSDIPSAVAVPNPASVVKSGNLAGANVEASNLKAAAEAYSADNQEVLRFTSDDLVPSYVSAKAKAKYYFSSATGLITRVDSVSGGWADIVFSLSQQKWIKGAPDNNHSGDQDIP
jgi:hypothetical protein